MSRWGVLGILVACGSDPPPSEPVPPTDTAVATDSDEPPTDTALPPIEPNWEQGIEPMFAERCAPCHFGYGFGDLSLEETADFVGVSSSTGMPIVASGDLEGSYLWHKVSDTHEEVGGSGERMPFETAPLSERERTAVSEWIELGTP